MSKQSINLGTAPTGVGGDTPRSAFTKLQSNVDELYTALGAAGSPQALPATLPILNGGTGVTTTAALLTALQAAGAYGKSNILGSVTVSGGVPTGALIEKGTNSSGDWTKWADGTMICRGFKDLGSQAITAGNGSLFYTGAFGGITFPQSFTTAPSTHIDIISATGLVWSTAGSALPSATATGSYYILSPTSVTASVSAMWIAIGRWF